MGATVTGKGGSFSPDFLTVTEGTPKKFSHFSHPYAVGRSHPWYPECMTNKIRSTDNKGRLTVGQQGILYCVHKNEDGTILLDPIKVPAPPEMEREDMRAIYVKPSGSASRPVTVTIYSSWGNLLEFADRVAALANELKVPVVVDAKGIGGAYSDALQQRGIEVIEKLY